METLRYYDEDVQIAKALLKRDEAVTYNYFYVHCYPLFKSIYNRFYTDCDSVKELIDEIYLLVLTPSKKTGRCQLENYCGQSTLASWLKAVSLFYCYKQFEKKNKIPAADVIGEDTGTLNDRIIKKGGSIDIDFSNLNRADANAIIKLMPNKRYREIIRLLYLEQKSNEETAMLLGMTLANLYNKKRLAQAQYKRIKDKEECHG